MTTIAQLGIAVNSEAATQAASDLDELVSAGARAERAADKVGSAWDKSAQKVGASSKKTTDAIDDQRESLEKLLGQIDPTVGALGRLDQMQDRLAKFKASGVLPADDFAEYTAKIDQTRAGLSRFDEGMNRTGNTAKQNAQALRMLPAQFSDIFVSLQGGQAPLTVFLQQGAQIKDSFGGIGASAKALGGYALALVNPFTVAAAAAGALTLAYYQGSKEADAYRLALVTTGNAAGSTTTELAAMAERVGATVGTTGEASSALSQLASSGKIASESFEQIATAAISFEKAGGQAVSATVAEFAKIGEDPVKAIAALNEKYNFLTAAVYEQVRSLQEQGDKQGAAVIAEKAYADALQSRSNEIKTNLGTIERAWRDVASAAKSGWDSVLGVGRESTKGPDLTKLKQELAYKTSLVGTGYEDDTTKARIKTLQSEIDVIEKRTKSELESAKATADTARTMREGTKAYEEFHKGVEDRYTKTEKMNKALEVEQKRISQSRAAGFKITEEQEKAAYKAIRERTEYQEKTTKKAVDLTSFNDADNKLKALTASYQNSLRILDASQKAGLISSQQYAEQKSALISKEKTEVEAAYNGQITALESVREKSTTTGAQRIQIDQKIADARSKMVDALKKLDADQEVLSVEMRGRIEKDEAAIKAFAQTVQDSLNLAQQGLDNQLAGFGLSDRDRARLQEDLKIRQDYQKQMERLTRDYGNIVNPTSGDKDKYDRETRILEDALSERLSKQEKFYRDEEQLRGDWSNGVSRAWRNYVDEASDAAGLTESAFGNAFTGIEDVFVDFITTGKASFKDFANSVIADLARIVVKQQVIAPLLNAVFGGGGGGNGATSFGSAVGSLIGGGNASDSNGWGGMVSLGKNLYSAWSNLTGVGSSIASGYASGGISGALSGGVGYYGNMLSSLGSTLSSGFSSIVSSITGTAAASTAATTGATSALGGALSGAVAEGAASIGTNIGIAGATTAAASNGIGAAISSAMSSAAAMWPLAIVMGMYQSGKLYSAGVRPDAGEMWDSAGSTALGKAAMLPQTVGAKYFEVTDNILGKVVGGKMAAILSGSTLFQAVWSKVGSKLFGSGYKTKDTGIELGVDGGLFDAQQYTKQKKKGGLLSGSSKTRYLHSALDAETQDALGSAYNEKILNSMGLFSALGVELSESVLDGLNMATTRISTQGKTPEAIQEQLDAWFGKLGDSAVAAINTATNSGLQDYNFEALTTFVNNLYSVNAAVESLGVKAVGFTVAGGKAVETMIAVSGGIEALSTGMNDYYSAFTTEMDKSADSLAAARAEFTKFGFSLPDTRDGLKEVVQALDLTTEIGQNMFSAIVRNATAASQAYGILEARESAYRSAFFSESEQTAFSIKETTDQLKALGVTLPGTRDQFRDMVEAAKKDTSAAGKELYDSLMSVAGAAGTAFDSMEASAKSAADAAQVAADAIASALNLAVTNDFSTVQRSITAQQKAATAAYNATNTSLSDMSATAVKSVTDLSSVSNSLESALKSLRGTSDDSVKTLRAQAQATLQSALATARAGGSLSGFSGLEDALDTVSSNNTDLYSSMEDFARDQGRTANVVAELNAINGKQLTAAEKLQKSLEDQIGVAKAAYDAQMAQFDQQLEFAQAQMDAFNGIDTSVKSVEAAIKALNGSLIASLAAKPATGAGSAMANTAANNATVVDTLYQQLFGRTADAGENKYWADRLGSGNLPYAEIVANMTQYASAADKAAMAAMGKVPAYASGGDHLGGLRLVGENGPELEVTGPSRIYNANQTASMLNGGGGNGELIAEVRQLRTENRQAQFQIVKLTQKIEQTMSQWNGEGMPQEREYAL